MDCSHCLRAITGGTCAIVYLKRHGDAQLEPKPLHPECFGPFREALKKRENVPPHWEIDKVEGVDDRGDDEWTQEPPKPVR